ncbi:MAG: formylglycine-generating enzyme family protein [Bacteroidota bacterium]|jgi:formylglycine-generating enzyme required for sulfatase activity
MKPIFFKGLWSVVVLMLTVSNLYGQSNVIHEPETVLVSEGVFFMGRPFNHPQIKKEGGTEVYVSTFRIGKFEVTQKEFEEIMEYNPSVSVCATCPVNNLNYYDAWYYCYLLSEKTGKKYRLPTEAEWEWAAMGGAIGSAKLLNGFGDKTKMAWHAKNSKGIIHPVGLLEPNSLGIYDMLGNVEEITGDLYNRYYYVSNTNNPKGLSKGRKCVVKGGHYDSMDGEDYGTEIINGIETAYIQNFDISSRDFMKKKKTDLYKGFRVVLEVSPN